MVVVVGEVMGWVPEGEIASIFVNGRIYST